ARVREGWRWDTGKRRREFRGGETNSLLGKGGLCTTNRAGRTWSENTQSAFAARQFGTSLCNQRHQSASSITSRHNGLLRIVQKDVTNWRVANADSVFRTSLRFVVQKPQRKG